MGLQTSIEIGLFSNWKAFLQNTKKAKPQFCDWYAHFSCLYFASSADRTYIENKADRWYVLFINVLNYMSMA